MRFNESNQSWPSIWCTISDSRTQIHNLCWLFSCHAYSLCCWRNNSCCKWIWLNLIITYCLLSFLFNDFGPFHISLQALLCLVDKKTGAKSKTRPRFVKQDQVAIMRIECSGLICLEAFKIMPQLGRFTLRDESKYFCFFILSSNIISNFDQYLMLFNSFQTKLLQLARFYEFLNRQVNPAATVFLKRQYIWHKKSNERKFAVKVNRISFSIWFVIELKFINLSNK